MSEFSPAATVNSEPVLVELSSDLSCWTTPERFDLVSEIQFIHAEIFEQRCYLRHSPELPAEPVVLDIGANVGLFSIFIARERPRAKIWAFEPMPDTLSALRRNIETHHLDGVSLQTVALGAENEDAARFTFYPRFPGNSTRYPDDKAVGAEFSINQIGQEAHDYAMEAHSVEVDVRRLSDVLASSGPEGPIDLVKIDVEGAELDVLKGMDETDWARISCFVIEVQDLRGRLATVLEVLDAHGFDTVVEQQEELSKIFHYFMVYAHRRDCATALA
ncbi:MAG TPA: FkbM family methyltransferase [Pseudonocardia sp.]|jgi:FkbM family methyltransferase|nr:FkbM family methyltransferase [Pseudonocardia sp.]